VQVPKVERGATAGGANDGDGARDGTRAVLHPLLLADGSGPAEQATSVRLGYDDAALRVRFECRDRDAWSTFRRRNDPLYLEEAVEVFLAPGEADPRRYLELEVSPHGVLFAARIHNPTGRRADLEADTGWDDDALAWSAGKSAGKAASGEEGQDWWAEIAIPWRAAWRGRHREEALPRLWRANFYRIERPRDGGPEFSCWSPTFTDPADFHQPSRFGVLELV
jgi:hypothetical protein